MASPPGQAHKSLDLIQSRTSIIREVLCLLKSHSLTSSDSHSQALPIPAGNGTFLLQGRRQEELRQDKG